MNTEQIILLVGGGIAIGIVNTLAGGGSVITVPLLVLIGLPGTIANGTNRLGVFTQSAVAAWRFRVQGVSGVRNALPLLFPIALGSFVGSSLISQVADKTFERLFGVVMIALLAFILRRPASAPEPGRARQRWSGPVVFMVFLGIGLYGGAFQAGVGIALVLALSSAGYDLVKANSIKVVVNATLTVVAIPVFLSQGQIAWLPGLLLAAGFGLGGELGARIAVRGGERIIRPVLTISVIVLAGRMLGLY